MILTNIKDYKLLQRYWSCGLKILKYGCYTKDKYNDVDKVNFRKLYMSSIKLRGIPSEDLTKEPTPLKNSKKIWENVFNEPSKLKKANMPIICQSDIGENSRIAVSLISKKLIDSHEAVKILDGFTLNQFIHNFEKGGGFDIINELDKYNFIILYAINAVRANEYAQNILIELIEYCKIKGKVLLASSNKAPLKFQCATIIFKDEVKNPNQVLKDIYGE